MVDDIDRTYGTVSVDIVNTDAISANVVDAGDIAGIKSVSGGTASDIQTAIQDLPSERSAPGIVTVAGDITVGSGISLPAQTILDTRRASLTAESGLDAAMLSTPAGVGNAYLLGGDWDHNGTNQSAGQAAIWFRDVTDGGVRGVTLSNAYDRGIEVDGGENVTVSESRVQDTGRGTGGPSQGTGHPIMFWSGDKTVERRHSVRDCTVSGGPIGFDFGDVRGVDGSGLTAFNVGNNGISTDNCHEITISNFHIDSAGSWGVVVNEKDISLTNGFIENSGAKAVHIDGSDISLAHVTSNNCGGTAFTIANLSRRVELNDCKAIDPDSRGFRTQDAGGGTPADLSFSECWALGSGQNEPTLAPGFDLETGSIITVDNCKAFDCWTDGLFVNAGNVTVNGGIYKNNNRKGVDHSGVRLGDTASECVVSGLRAFDDQSTKTQTNGVEEISGADYNAITGNVLRGNASSGLSTSGTNTTTTGNIS